jgi:hypothetical protein
MLPDWLEGPVRAVLHDLQQPREVRVKVRYREDPVTGERVLLLSERPGGFMAGLSLGDTCDSVGLTMVIADQLQSQFFIETETAWGEARPACPGHAHAALAELGEDGQAWWVCPSERRPIARIGELGTGRS